MALARQALDRLVWTPGERRTHRWVRGRGPRVDLRRRSRTACARAATSSSCRGAGAARGRARSSCSATSAARWSATRACCCTSPMRIGRRHRRVEAFVFATELTRVTANCGPGGSTRRSAQVVAVGARLVRAARDRRVAPAVRAALGAPHAPWRPGGAAHLRRLGPRRSGRARAIRSGAAAELPSTDLAQPAHRHRRTTRR